MSDEKNLVGAIIAGYLVSGETVDGWRYSLRITSGEYRGYRVAEMEHECAERIASIEAERDVLRVRVAELETILAALEVDNRICPHAVPRAMCSVCPEREDS